MNTELMFSSKTDDWATPHYFFDALDREFEFTTDVCASDDNHKCEIYYTEAMNGLECPWYGNVWMNPPYGRKIGDWVARAREQAAAGFARVVVCLVPARVDARWFQDNAAYAAEIRMVRGRLAFGAGTSAAPFPCAVIVFKHGHVGPPVWSFYAVEKK